MSVHTRIAARITSLQALTALFNQQGIEWGEATVSNLRRGEAANAVWCRVGQETVYVCQWEVGKPFQFMWDKPSTSRLVRALTDQTAQRGRGRAEPQQTEATNITNERRFAEEARRRLDDAERQRRTEEQLHVAADNQRIAEEQRRVADDHQRLEEQRRQRQLQREAGELLARLDSQQAAAASVKPPIQSPTPSSGPTPGGPPTQALENLVGKLHQIDALRRIKENLPLIEDRFGARLESEQTLEDETVELKLTL